MLISQYYLFFQGKLKTALTSHLSLSINPLHIIAHVCGKLVLSFHDSYYYYNRRVVQRIDNWVVMICHFII